MKDGSFSISGRIVDVVEGRIFPGTLLVSGGKIIAVREEAVADKRYIMPGLTDAHIHIESSMLIPSEFARLAVMHGTVATVSDPHEIANVLGIEGIKFMIANGRKVPFKFYFGASSCVPATPFETSGAALGVEEIDELLGMDEIYYLSEMMNFPGVLAEDPEVMAKLRLARVHGKPVDGHAPGLRGEDARKYIEAGISTDHECFSLEEAMDKAGFGMKVLIREGSAARNFETLAPLLNLFPDQVMFCSDDRHPDDLARRHIDDIVRRALTMGYDPLTVIRACTLNPARHYRLYDRGALAPGYRADLVVFEDLSSFRASLVIKDGRPVARDGRMVSPIDSFQAPPEVLHSVRLARAAEEKDFALQAPVGRVPVIGVIPGQLITEKLQLDLKRGSDGLLKADPAAGINKIAVIERHRASGRLAVALVRGFGLREGALASSVAHDSHNIIVVGVEEKAMAVAVNELARLGGGFAAVDGRGEVRASLALPVAGLMSAEPATVVAENMKELLKAARGLGTEMPQPFLTLSFLALPVIPSLKITDRGLFDVDSFSFI